MVRLVLDPLPLLLKGLGVVLAIVVIIGVLVIPGCPLLLVALLVVVMVPPCRS